MHQRGYQSVFVYWGCKHYIRTSAATSECACASANSGTITIHCERRCNSTILVGTVVGSPFHVHALDLVPLRSGLRCYI
jgi:hypothetical protein